MGVPVDFDQLYKHSSVVLSATVSINKYKTLVEKGGTQNPLMQGCRNINQVFSKGHIGYRSQDKHHVCNNGLYLVPFVKDKC